MSADAADLRPDDLKDVADVVVPTGLLAGLALATYSLGYVQAQLATGVTLTVGPPAWIRLALYCSITVLALGGAAKAYLNYE
jgi:hypothetical protein